MSDESVRPEQARKPRPGNLRPDLAAEARAEAVTIEFEGEIYTLPPFEDWPASVIEAAEQEHYYAMVRLAVGSENWAKIQAKDWSIRQFNAFAELINEHWGN